MRAVIYGRPSTAPSKTTLIQSRLYRPSKTSPLSFPFFPRFSEWPGMPVVSMSGRSRIPAPTCSGDKSIRAHDVDGGTRDPRLRRRRKISLEALESGARRTAHPNSDSGTLGRRAAPRRPGKIRMTRPLSSHRRGISRSPRQSEYATRRAPTPVAALPFAPRHAKPTHRCSAACIAST